MTSEVEWNYGASDLAMELDLRIALAAFRALVRHLCTKALN